MHDGQVSSAKVLAGALWVWVGALILAGWVLFIIGSFGPQDPAASVLERAAFMLMLSGCASSAVAAVFHIRTFAFQLCSLIQATSALGSSDQLGVRHIPRQDRDRDPVR